MATSKDNHPNYRLTVGATRHVAGVAVVSLIVHDCYTKKFRHRVERRMVRAFIGFLEVYLRRHPELQFESPRNFPRHLIYLPAGMRAWRGYMPNGFATHHVYDPEYKKMANGKTLDPMTRGFFRHTFDAVGLRSRSHMMSWAVAPLIRKKKGDLRWLSLAGGSGLPVYDAIAEHPAKMQKKLSLTIADVSQTILEFAQQVARLKKIDVGAFDVMKIDATDAADYTALLNSIRPSIVDAMGLFEYLSFEQSVKLLRAVYSALPSGGLMVFTNMSPRHPQLHVHRRALGWPGVIQRTIHEVAAIMNEAGIPAVAQHAYHDQDGVYNVYKVAKQ